MFDHLIDKEVEVIVSTKSDILLEYTGVLCKETEVSLILENAEINPVMLNFQKNIFGGSMNNYKQNVEEIIINKQYVVSCNKK